MHLGVGARSMDKIVTINKENVQSGQHFIFLFIKRTGKKRNLGYFLRIWDFTIHIATLVLGNLGVLFYQVGKEKDFFLNVHPWWKGAINPQKGKPKDGIIAIATATNTTTTTLYRKIYFPTLSFSILIQWFIPNNIIVWNSLIW